MGKMDIGLKLNENLSDAYLLTEQQYRAIEMLINGELTHSQIADEVGVHRNTICRWLRDDRFVAELQECANEKKRQTMNFINSKSLIAAKKLWALTDSGDTRTKCAVLQDWLNRAIGKPNSKVEITDNREQQEDYDIESAMKRLENESPNVIPIKKQA